jgi:hypothetical protein
LVTQDDGRRDDRTREGPATGFIDAGDHRAMSRTY